VLDQDAHLVGDQAATARKLDRLDKWRTILLAATLVFGIALAALIVYDAWQRGALPNN